MTWQTMSVMLAGNSMLGTSGTATDILCGAHARAVVRTSNILSMPPSIQDASGMQLC
jgi:hypothetical protein